MLLFIAMPLKYLADRPIAVEITGAIHGGLFIVFILSTVEVTIRRPWWSPKFWFFAAMAALLPFGAFVFDRWLKKVQQRDVETAAAKQGNAVPT